MGLEEIKIVPKSNILRLIYHHHPYYFFQKLTLILQTVVHRKIQIFTLKLRNLLIFFHEVGTTKEEIYSLKQLK